MNNPKVTGIAQHTNGEGLCELDIFFDNKMVMEIMSDDVHISFDDGLTFCGQTSLKAKVEIINRVRKSSQRLKVLISELNNKAIK
jgi:hypothetical protein